MDPCIWKSPVRAICLRSTGLLLFREMTPGMVSVFSTLLGSTADTCSASVYEDCWKNFTLSYVKGGLSDPVFDPCPYDCKLWSLRSCTPSLVVDIPVIAHRQIPMVLRFSNCSTLIGWSTFVVHVQQVRVQAARNCRVPTVAARILDLVVHTPVVCNDSRPWSMSSCSSSTLVGVAVVPQRQVPAVGLDSWMWGRFFFGPAHRCRAGGRVHRDTAP